MTTGGITVLTLETLNIQIGICTQPEWWQKLRGYQISADTVFLQDHKRLSSGTLLMIHHKIIINKQLISCVRHISLNLATSKIS